MIPYSIKIFKNSPLATIVGIIGTLLWVAGVTLLINSYFAPGLACFIVAFITFIYAAPAIADHKERKLAGINEKRPFTSFLRDNRISLLILLLLTLITCAVCIYKIVDTQSNIQAQKNAADVYSGEDSQYVTGDVFSFIETFAYEGEDENSATNYVAAVLLPKGDKNVVAPLYFDAADLGDIDAATADFSKFLNNGQSSSSNYSGKKYHLLGSIHPISELNPDIVKFYDEMLSRYDVKGYRADFYIETSKELSASDYLIEFIVLCACVLLSIFLIAAVIIGFMEKGKKPDEHIEIISDISL